ncbi:MAG: hypothetical protein QME12_06960, partial [Nanoarchaeota archaeon]|nr:hypothetical protein [Nanoarchaeota archaeon]
MEKKGQAAMEFLMTYGWAILVVLVAIGALAYFGVLSPSKFLPSSCTLEPGFGCDSFKADDSADNIQLILRNGKGQSMTAVGVEIAGCTADLEANGDDPWNDGEILGAADGITLTSCSLGAAGDRLKKDITITYTDASGISHTVVGDLTTKI